MGLGAGTLITENPVSFISDLEDRALAAMRNGDTAAAQLWRFRQLYRQYFDTEACARAALGPYWQQATAQQRQEFINRYEDYVVITYSLPLGQIGAQSFTVLGQPARSGRGYRHHSDKRRGPAQGGLAAQSDCRWLQGD